jgi:hypothetical protein
VVGGGDADSIFQFRLKRGGDGMKHCQKMKRRQRTRLHSMERKCDTVQWRCDVDRRRDDTVNGKGMRQCQLG